MKIQNYAVLGMLSLTACVASEPQGKVGEKPATKQAVTKEGSIDVTYTNPNAKATADRIHPVGISVVTLADKTDNKESATRVVKAKCALKGDGFHASFSAPAYVNLPSHGPETKPLTMTCEHNGESYTDVFKVQNLSANARAAASVGSAVFCIPCAIGTGAASAIPREGDVYGFSNIQMKI